MNVFGNSFLENQQSVLLTSFKVNSLKYEIWSSGHYRFLIIVLHIVKIHFCAPEPKYKTVVFFLSLLLYMHCNLIAPGSYQGPNTDNQIIYW